MLNEWQRSTPSIRQRASAICTVQPAVLGTGRNRPAWALEAPRSRPRRTGRARASAGDPLRGRSSRTPSAWCPRFWSLTALPPWLPPAVPRWRSWMPACRSRLLFPASPWASSRKATTSSSCPTSKALRTSSATWTSKCAARRRASRPCRWTTRPRACPLKSLVAR